MSDHEVKAILGYDIEPGIPVSNYEAWLAEIHFPDLLANPHLTRIEVNTVVRSVPPPTATPSASSEPPFFRIAELHFTDHDAYEAYLAWFDEHPIPADRGPAGRTAFRFYVLTDSTTVDRDHDYPPAQHHISTPEPTNID